MSESQLPLLSVQTERNEEIPHNLSHGPSSVEQQQKKSPYFTILFSFTKMVITIALSLSLTTYWKKCGKSGNPKELQCSASGTSQECSTAMGDCWVYYYSDVGEQCKETCYFGGISVAGRDSDGCYAYVDQDCLCNFWYATVFVVIALNIIHFLVQIAFYIFGDEFNPQNLYYQVAVNNGSWDTYKLIFQPRNCFLSTFETITIFFAFLPIFYGEDIENSVSCTEVGVTATVTGQYYNQIVFGLAITVMELYKANVRGMMDYNKYNNFILNKLVGLTYFLRFDITLRCAFINFTQSIVFVLSLAMLGIPLWYCKSGYSDLKEHYELHMLYNDQVDKHWRLLCVSLASFAVFILLVVIAIVVVGAFFDSIK